MKTRMSAWVLVAIFACACKSKVSAPVESPPPAKEASVAVEPVDDYPKTRRDDVVENIHGVRVADPYRWLEDPDKPEVAAWMEAQDKHARDRLGKLADRPAFTKKLDSVMYYDSVSAPEHRGDRFFYSRKHKDKEKRVVYWKEGENGAEKVLLDPNAWSADGSTGLKRWEVSWDGKYVAYNVSEHNADETSLKVLEVATGRVLPDEIPNTRFGQTSWTTDNRGFYYSYTPPASDKIAEADRSAHTDLRYHKLGDGWTKDRVAHRALGVAGWFITGVVSEDGHWLLVVVSRGSSGSSDWYFQDLRGRDPKWTTLVEGIDADFSLAYYRDAFYMMTNEKAPRYRLLVADPARPQRENWREVVPESDATLDNVDVFGGKLVLSYLRDAASVLEVHDLDGKLIRKVDMPALGSSSGVVGRADEDEVYFNYSSFTEPNVVYKTSVRTGTTSEWSRIKLPIDTSRFVTEQVRYPSKDGTQVTMFVVHARDAKKNRRQPTLLNGYGGFRIPLKPEFYSRYAAWLDMGGVVAVANLRGGGEYGEEWHKAGMLGKKQNVFDDFIAAADYLETSGWTSPGHLAIYGGSNGGLLMGAALTQAPEKFKAVVCFVPLLDMIRYHKFGLGKAWVTEYGSADDPAQFQALLAYSPYHRLTAGPVLPPPPGHAGALPGSYPAFLMMSSDHDDRVDPMHARKFTAALQRAVGGRSPVWLRIERNAAHGGADVVKQQVDQWADALAFAWRQVAD